MPSWTHARTTAYVKTLGFTYSYSPWHWGVGPLWDVFWTHPQYLMHCYYLTGYERRRTSFNSWPMPHWRT